MQNKIHTLALSLFCPRILEREQRRAEMEAAVRKHWTNSGPIHLYELIREEWEDTKGIDHNPFYVVFIDKDIEIDWITQNALPRERSEAISYAESISARECKHLSRNRQLEFQRLIGQAIVCAIEGSLEYSRQTTEMALQSLHERTIERSRQWTLQWASAFLWLCVCIFLLSEHDFLCDFGWSVFGGIVGANLSIIQKVGKGKWNAAAGQWIHFVEVGSKISAGGVLGGVSYAVLQSPLCPQIFASSEKSIHFFFLFGVMSGLFERLIPKILSSYGDAEREEKK